VDRTTGRLVRAVPLAGQPSLRPLSGAKVHGGVWLGGDSETACWRQRLFLHLGLGRSIRQYDTPITLTKEMERHFMLAPDDASVEGALRWGQVRGLGIPDCLRRYTSIWSMKIHQGDRSKRVLTIEVLPGNQDDLAGKGEEEPSARPVCMVDSKSVGRAGRADPR
jgi:hypothetical protein